MIINLVLLLLFSPQLVTVLDVRDPDHPVILSTATFWPAAYGDRWSIALIGNSIWIGTASASGLVRCFFQTVDIAPQMQASGQYLNFHQISVIIA